MKYYFGMIGLILPLLAPAFSPLSLDYKEKIKNRLITKSFDSAKSAPSFNDNVQELFPELTIEKNLLALPLIGAVKDQPWSDDYWPIYKGILGARYAKEEFHELYTWKEAKEYVTSSPLSENMNHAFIDELSPSEKFDLLHTENHLDLPLTSSMWKQGEQYLTRYNEIEKWMGICHGWAAASFMVKRPKNSVTVKDAKNKNIIFYPSDIKGLVSLLWASGKYQNHFVGGRCNSRDPEVNESGRPLRQDCFDNNPATFHLAVANGVGIHRKSFVMDVTFDYEVWNQPISSYAMIFENVISKKRSDNPQDAIIELKNYRDDPYKDFRSKDAKYIVGVSIEVNYIVETQPSQLNIDHMDFDGISLSYYAYDLELDEDYNIIGGEWGDREHPDFLWRPAENAQALTFYDYYIMSDHLWDGKAPLQDQYKELASKAAREGSPLAYIIRSLVNLSQNQQERDNE